MAGGQCHSKGGRCEEFGGEENQAGQVGASLSQEAVPVFHSRHLCLSILPTCLVKLCR